MKKIKSSIALKSISFVILMLIAFAGIVSITGYQVFSEEMYEEFATDAFKVARAAAHCVEKRAEETLRNTTRHGFDSISSATLQNPLLSMSFSLI